jgi:hypothetical protein
MSHGLNVKKGPAVLPAPIDVATWMQQHQVTAVLVDDQAADTYGPMLRAAGADPVYGGEGVSVWRPVGGTWSIPATTPATIPATG